MHEHPPSPETVTVGETGWTIATLLVHLNGMAVMRDRGLTVQLEALQREFHEHLEAAQRENLMALQASDKAIMKAEVATDKALAKVEAATEKRFESVNEFRATLSDQAGLFMTRAEATALIDRVTAQLADARAVSETHITRVDTEAFADRNAERIQDLTDRLNRAEGKGSGLNAGWSYVLGGVALIGTLVSIFVVSSELLMR